MTAQTPDTPATTWWWSDEAQEAAATVVLNAPYGDRDTPIEVAGDVAALLLAVLATVVADENDAEAAAAERRGAETEREEIAKALHIARFDHQDGSTSGPDTFYNGMRSAAALVRARAAAADGGAS